MLLVVYREQSTIPCICEVWPRTRVSTSTKPKSPVFSRGVLAFHLGWITDLTSDKRKWTLTLRCTTGAYLVRRRKRAQRFLHRGADGGALLSESLEELRGHGDVTPVQQRRKAQTK